MHSFRFSRQAETDLNEIIDYTLNAWNLHQAERYIADLERSCQHLADNPSLGRPCNQIRKGLHRLEIGKHTIFYELEHSGILVLRILHQRMLPEHHHMEGGSVAT